MAKKIFLLILSAAILTLTPIAAYADEYVIDTKNANAFIQFKISHLGFSWVLGRFNRFKGTFTYDEKNPPAAKVRLTVDVSSIDTNNAERDKFFRGEEFFDVKKYPEATFVSTSFEPLDEGRALLTGDLTLHGVTRRITVKIRHIGAGKDPWGGFRRGFEGSTTLTLTDFNINADLDHKSKEVELFLSIEGIRQ